MVSNLAVKVFICSTDVGVLVLNWSPLVKWGLNNKTGKLEKSFSCDITVEITGYVHIGGLTVTEFSKDNQFWITFAKYRAYPWVSEVSCQQKDRHFTTCSIFNYGQGNRCRQGLRSLSIHTKTQTDNCLTSQFPILLS